MDIVRGRKFIFSTFSWKRHMNMQSTIVSATPLVERPGRAKLFSQKALDGFRRDSKGSLESTRKGRIYNVKAAAANTARAPLARKLRNRHLQMIAIGGSIGKSLTPTM
jgi:hypothetical protein